MGAAPAMGVIKVKQPRWMQYSSLPNQRPCYFDAVERIATFTRPVGMHLRGSTVWESLENSFVFNKNRPCFGVFQEGDTINWRSYAQVWAEVQQLASSLCRLGINPGEFVATWSINRPQLLTLDWACTRQGFPMVRLLERPALPTLLPPFRFVSLPIRPWRKSPRSFECRVRAYCSAREAFSHECWALGSAGLCHLLTSSPSPVLPLFASPFMPASALCPAFLLACLSSSPGPPSPLVPPNLRAVVLIDVPSHDALLPFITPVPSASPPISSAVLPTPPASPSIPQPAAPAFASTSPAPARLLLPLLPFMPPPAGRGGGNGSVCSDGSDGTGGANSSVWRLARWATPVGGSLSRALAVLDMGTLQAGAADCGLPVPHQPRPDDLYTVVFTSGSTGSPKVGQAEGRGEWKGKVRRETGKGVEGRGTVDKESDGGLAGTITAQRVRTQRVSR